MKRKLTLKQWRAELGEAVSVYDAARIIGRTPADLARAAAARELHIHRFDAADGRAFYLIRVDDLLDYQRRQARLQQGLTPEGMRRAFAKMAAA